jgi:hypothetical protein
VRRGRSQKAPRSPPSIFEAANPHPSQDFLTARLANFPAPRAAWAQDREKYLKN